MIAYYTEILEMWLVNFSAWIVSWMAFSYMFGATCIAVEESVAGFTPSAWRSFLNVGERLGSFLCLSLLLFVLALVAAANFDARGNRRVLDIASKASAPYPPSDCRGFVRDYKLGFSRFVKIRAGCTGSAFGRLQCWASDVS